MDKEKSKKDLLTGAVITGGVGAGLLGLQRGAAKAEAKRTSARQQREASVRARNRRRQKLESNLSRKDPSHPKAKAADRARAANPDVYKKTVKAGRLARRAARASSKLGAVGAVAGVAGGIGEARKIQQEGGSWINRFGKFVEHMTGFPAGSSGRGMTEKEKKAQWEM